MRLRVVLTILVALALAVGVGWWLRRDDSTQYARALDTLPAETLRVAYTDWSYARSNVEGSDLASFIDAAYDADITRTSALETNAVELDDIYDISLKNAEWEIYGQAEAGAVDVLRVEDGLSFSRLRGTLRTLGYGEPSSDEGAWTGDENMVAQISGALTPVMENVVLLEEQHLVLLSDDAAYVEDAAKVIDGSADSLLGSVSGLVSPLDEPTSALLWASDYACQALAMSSADATDQSTAERLISDAGGVTPLDGLVMARESAKHVTVSMQFVDHDQAVENLQPRTTLASGDAPGLGGSFTDRFDVDSGKAIDDNVVLRLTASPDEDELLTSISDGPVLFATC